MERIFIRRGPLQSFDAGHPRLNDYRGEDSAGKLPHARYALITDTAAYIVSYTDNPYSSEDPALVKRALDSGRDNVLAQDPSMGMKLLSEKEVVLEGTPGVSGYSTATTPWSEPGPISSTAGFINWCIPGRQTWRLIGGRRRPAGLDGLLRKHLYQIPGLFQADSE